MKKVKFFLNMKPFIFIGLFAAINLTVFSQEYISGKVIYYNDGLAMPGVTILIGNSIERHTSDINGEFRILKPTTQGETMTISFMGFKTVTIENIDTISHPITITMTDDFWGEYRGEYWRNHWEDYWDWNFTLSIQIDGLNTSFNNFESILGKENVDNLNSKLNMNLGLEYALKYGRFYFAINHGHVSQNNVELDSAIKGDFRTFSLGAHIGYKIIKSKSFLVTPKFSVKWYRYRMINNDSEWSIPIAQHITDRDLDIRFNHLLGFAGLNCSYVLFKDLNFLFFNTQAFTVGFYGGYVFPLNSKTWVYSNHNRLITDQKVEFNNFNFGITLAFIFDI